LKILAIAGRNLTSLGHFELNLDRPPFDREGLFAITGHTGAGKSTILDAMCVALYNRIPRLPARGPSLDDDPDNPFTKLSAADPRNIMRRGAKSCFAETTFTGTDGYRYRARWEVPPRVRKSTTLNDPSMSLVNLDTGWEFAEKRTEVLPVIVEKVGLTFEQFCRSVLLAQGDFAAFLKAGSDERAALLERMTGTEIYKDLSIAAHERGKLEIQKLQELMGKVETEQLLPAEVRDELEAKCKTGEQELEALRSAWRRQNDLVSGFQRLASLETALEKAVQQYKHAEGAWHELAGTFRDLQRWERLADCREAYLDTGRLTSRLDGLKEKEKALIEALPELERSVKHAETAMNGSLEKRLALTRQIEAQRPLLEEARKLDHQLENIKTQQKALVEKSDLARQATEKAKLELDQCQAKFANLTQQVETWRQSEKQRRHLELLAKAWPQHRDALTRFEELKNQIQAHAIDLLGQLWQAGAARAQLSDVHQVLARGRSGLKAISTVVSENHAASGGASRSDWYQSRQAIADQQHGLAELKRIQQNALHLLQEDEKATTQLEAIRQRRQQHQSLEVAGEKEIGQLSAAREESRSHHERLLRASSETANALRAGLKNGEACPVCGATEHPFAHNQPFDPLLEESKARLHELDQSIQDWQSRLANARSQADRDGETLEQLEEASKTRKADMASLTSDLAGLAKRPGFENLPNLASQAMTEAIGQKEAELESRAKSLEDMLADIEEAEARQELLTQSQAIVKDRLHRLEIHQTTLTGRCKDIEKSRTQLKADIERKGSALARLQQSLAPLMATIPNWQKALCANSEIFLADLEKEIHGYIEAKTQLETASSEMRLLEPELARLQENHQWQMKQMEALAGELEESSRQGQALEKQRRSLLDGRAVNEVETAQRNDLKAMEEQIQTQRDHWDKTTKTLEEKRVILEQHQQAIAECGDERDQARTRLEKGLKRLDFSLDEVEGLLGKDQAWMLSCREKLDEAKSSLNQAEGARKEVEKQLAGHRANFQAEGDLNQALENRETLERQREALEAQLAEWRQSLKADTETRARIGALEEAVEIQKAQAELWESMRELIGSHDGKKFRVFAQSLTLDMLLHHANHHLEDLARRYRLERLPGTDLDLRIVDQDMGDDIRGINSLSGGETFLVSLALALGLATFTTSQTPIESLFIDEGFGALDSESLDLALDALEALHTQGRQVGVISHVQTLSERIGIQVQVRKRGGGASSVHLLHQGVDIGV